ncbi:MAG: hypothetical protein U0903_04390 [Planctomycetales bacterium]
MPIEFPCPHCGALIVNVPEKYAGQKGRCLHCKKPVVIPSPAPPIAPAAAAPEESLPEVVPEVIPDPVIPPSILDRKGKRNRFGGGQRYAPAGSQKYQPASSQRYPALGRYRDILTILSYVIAVLGMAWGVIVMLMPLLVSAAVAGKPSAGPYEALASFFVGLVICLGTYVVMIILLAVAEGLRVLMDIEENTRKETEKG